ncbi:hypothetical protein DFH09DRAFT_1072402 [Mycena vulgaris]|nr:hypothetical protein DFH09DRAFT_1072402 [Mycena vulgaris]
MTQFKLRWLSYQYRALPSDAQRRNERDRRVHEANVCLQCRGDSIRQRAHAPRTACHMCERAEVRSQKGARLAHGEGDLQDVIERRDARGGEAVRGEPRGDGGEGGGRGFHEFFYLMETGLNEENLSMSEGTLRGRRRLSECDAERNFFVGGDSADMHESGRDGCDTFVGDLVLGSFWASRKGIKRQL